MADTDYAEVLISKEFYLQMREKQKVNIEYIV